MHWWEDGIPQWAALSYWYGYNSFLTPNFHEHKKKIGRIGVSLDFSVGVDNYVGILWIVEIPVYLLQPTNMDFSLKLGKKEVI